MAKNDKRRTVTANRESPPEENRPKKIAVRPHGAGGISLLAFKSVSYTHLDVYKRQLRNKAPNHFIEVFITAPFP